MYGIVEEVLELGRAAKTQLQELEVKSVLSQHDNKWAV